MRVTFRWIIDRLKHILSELNTQGHRRDSVTYVTALGRLLRRWAVCGQFVSAAYLKIYQSVQLFLNFTQHLYRVLVVSFEYINFDLLLVPYYDLFSRFDTHFVPGADLENYSVATGISHMYTWSLRSLVVPFQVFLPWSWFWPSTLT